MLNLNKKFNKKNFYILIIVIVSLCITSCKLNFDFLYPDDYEREVDKEKEVEKTLGETKVNIDMFLKENKITEIEMKEEPYLQEKIFVDFTAPYATYSIINQGSATLYKHNPNYKHIASPNNIVVAINAGHGTKNGSKIMTFSHPDFSPKVAGGTNAEGSILSSAISDGMVFDNGMTEAEANLKVAIALKEKLLEAGYDVLMIREDDDCRLDNIARTVIANQNADVHIAIHFDSTASNKGIFYIAPYNNALYLNMEPVKSNASRINKIGKSIIEAFREMGEPLWKDSGVLQGDLTQISYSTNASVDIELGDKATILSDDKIEIFTDGIKMGIDNYFKGTPNK